MSTYYVHVPNTEVPTAEVSASSTKHARTAYLDYLSRSGKIDWRDRQLTRKLVKVNKMSPGEIQTQVKLEYGVKEVPEQLIEAPADQIGLEEQDRPYGSIPMRYEPEPEREFEPSIGQMEMEEEGYSRTQTPKPRRDPYQDSPIAQASRKMGRS